MGAHRPLQRQGGRGAWLAAVLLNLEVPVLYVVEAVVGGVCVEKCGRASLGILLSAGRSLPCQGPSGGVK